MKSSRDFESLENTIPMGKENKIGNSKWNLSNIEQLNIARELLKKIRNNEMLTEQEKEILNQIPTGVQLLESRFLDLELDSGGFTR